MNSLRLYFDESGDFFGVDCHVVCGVVVTNDPTPTSTAITAAWDELKLDWRKFHATNRDDAAIARYIAHFRGKLAEASVGIVYAWHQNRQRYGHSFYVPLVERAVVEGWKHALPTYLAMTPRPASVPCVATLELRGNMNSVTLQKRLQEACRVVTVQAGAAPALSTNFLIPTAEKGSNPLVQLADLFANAFYRARRGEEAGIAALLADLPAYEAREAWINAPTQLDLQREVLTIAPPAAPPARGTERARAHVIIEKARATHKKARKVSPDDFRSLVKDLLGEPASSRAVQVSMLLDALPRIIDEEREYDVAEALVGVADVLVREERARGEQPVDLLDQWTVGATAVWVLVTNHRGRAVAGEPRVERALAIAERLQGDPRHAALMATLLNYVSVSFHNALDFAEAERRLGPYVDFYMSVYRAPPGVTSVKAPWIGTLFGTHAQTKAFAAHDRFFSDRGASLRESLQEARELSEYATMHFSAPDDLLRHSTYQAHMFMQEAMLLGDAAALGAAGDRLASLLAPEQAIADFSSSFPASAATGPGYRVSALLKQAWLTRARPVWLDGLIEVVLRSEVAIPAEHPYEQLVGYLALLSSGAARARLRKALREIGWKGLVGAIAACFDAQVDHDDNGLVSPERLAALRAASQAALPASWLAGQLRAELDRFGVARAGRAPGPLVLLPFNFC